MSAIDDIADHVSKDGKMPGPDWKSLSEIVNQASDSNHLSKLQRIASEQLAALIVASQSEDGCPSLEDCDMTQDDAGYWRKDTSGYWMKATSTTLPKDRYTISTSLKHRLARHAVEYAKALLEITE